jgi:hypothetical protein
VKVGVLVRMTEPQRDMLKRAAAAQGVSVSEFIRRTMLRAATPWNGSRGIEHSVPPQVSGGLTERNAR